MSEAIKPTLLHNHQVHALNEKHGWFEFRDAQSDVSRAFASDAIAEYERVRNEATAVCVATGLTPRQLVERVKELEEAAADFMEAQAALDNREGMGINAEPYEVLMRRRNAAWDDLEAALSTPLPNTVVETPT
jgi:enoyl reductase-like protein